MPCQDVTELIRIVVDDSDRLKDYRFTKRTCGRGVGVDALLMEILGGRAVQDILEISPDQFLAEHPSSEPLEEFLGLKHLIAVQSALQVLCGEEAGGPEALCAAAEIAFEGGDTILEAVIRVDLVTEEIKSCGNCRGCGNSKKPRKSAPIFN